MSEPNPTSTSRLRQLKLWADQRPDADPKVTRVLRLAVRLILFTGAEFSRNSLSLRAAALTYTVLLALVPMLAMSTAIVKGLGGDDSLRQAAYGYLETLDIDKAVVESPAATGEHGAENEEADLGGHLRRAVDQLFAYVDKTNFAAIGTFGVAGILLSVILVLGTIEEAMNLIWKASGGRPLGRKLADYLTILVLLPISVNVTFAAGALLQTPALLAPLESLVPVAVLQPLLLKALPLGLVTLTFLIMYLFFPNTKVRLFPALIGAAVAAFLWTLTQDLYLSLQIGVANYNTIYGSFATLPLFLVWVYLGWLFILAGAQLAYAWQNLSSCRLVTIPTSPAQRLDAAFAILDAVDSAHHSGQKLRQADLPTVIAGLSSPLVDEVLAQLCRQGVIHRSTDDRRLLPASADRAVGFRLATLAILGDDDQDHAENKRSRRVLSAAVAAGEELGGERPPTDGQSQTEPDR
jgi:membrane protein